MTNRITLCISVLILGIFIALAIKPLRPYLEERLPDEFRVDKIALDVEAEFPTPPLSPDQRSLLNQEFIYLGHGEQSIAFENRDQSIVLKFFLVKGLHGKKRYPIPKPTHWIPSHREKRQQRREKIARDSLFEALKGYFCAFEKIPEKTGLIALHLIRTEGDLPCVTVIDHARIKHIIDLNRASFVVQKKGETVKTRLSRLATEEEKREHLLALDRFFQEKAKNGFTDKRQSFMLGNNYAFLGDQPIQIDAGELCFSPAIQADPAEEMKCVKDLFTKWIFDEKLLCSDLWRWDR